MSVYCKQDLLWISLWLTTTLITCHAEYWQKISVPDFPTGSGNRQKRKILPFNDPNNKSKKWPYMPIRYAFSLQYEETLDNQEKDTVYKAIDQWEKYTCIRFQEVYDRERFEETVLVFTKTKGGCFSVVGRFAQSKGRRQTILLGKECFKEVWVIAHEIGHALGLCHELDRPDRDDYVTILWDNVYPGTEKYFDKSSSHQCNVTGIPYDVGSLMHYGATINGIDGRRAVQAKDPLLQKSIGHPDGIQFFDAKAVNDIYCKTSCFHQSLPQPCQLGGYQNPNLCSVCLCPKGSSGWYCEKNTEAEGADECGGVINVSEKVINITSPNYWDGKSESTFTYKPGQSCSWLIKAPKDKRIKLEFTGPRFSIPCTNCYPEVSCEDYVEIRYAKTMGTTGARFCCDKIPKDIIITKSNTAIVMLRTKQSSEDYCDYRWSTKYTGYGFQLSVKVADSGGSAIKSIGIYVVVATAILWIIFS